MGVLKIFYARGIKNGGFTLLEVLMAVTILSIGILGVATLAGTAVKSSAYSRNLTQATNLAQQKSEALMAVAYTNLQSTGTDTGLGRSCTGPTGPVSRPVYSCTPTTPTITVNGIGYTWAYTVTFIDLNGDGTASQTSDGLKRIDMTISWTDPVWRTTKTYTMTTSRGR